MDSTGKGRKPSSAEKITRRTDLTAKPVPQDALLAAYEGALDEATTIQPGKHAARLLDLLVAREQIACTLSVGPPPPAETLAALTELDQRLRQLAPPLIKAASAKTLAAWRAALQPPDEHWWWALTPTPAESSSPAWGLLNGVLLVVALSLATDIAIRLQVFGNGADFFTIFSGVTQLLLALLAGSAFTAVGAATTAHILDRLQITHRRQLATLILTSVPLVVIGACWLAVPTTARWYYQRGFTALQAHSVNQAIPLLERSASLDPTVGSAYYTLGGAYEDALEYDAALRAYRAAIGLDPALYTAYNNMARLYVLRLADGASALDLLGRAFAQNPPDAVRPTLLKNRAWARLTLGLYVLAERDLRDALALDAHQAEAHCLLARVLEERPIPDLLLARDQWQACLANTDGQQVVAAELLDQAREREEQRK